SPVALIESLIEISETDGFCLFWRMVSIGTFRKLALSFPETTEAPHFEKTSFRVKKKIFATYDDVNKRATIKLSEIDQDTFSSIAETIIFPVPNKWGRQGWTIIALKRVNKSL